MKRNVRLAIISASFVVFATFSATAHAKLVDVTIAGRIVDGYDAIGDFGLPGSNLGGDSFVAFMEFNTAVGDGQSDRFYDSLNGGASIGWSTPVVSAYFVVNGVKFSIPGTDYGAIYAESGDYTVISQYQNAGGGDVYFEIFADSPVLTAAVDQPFRGSIFDPHLSSSACYNNGDGSRDWCALSLDPTSMTIQPAAAPEPATWVMLMLGIGGLGAAMRAASQRRQELFDSLSLPMRGA